MRILILGGSNSLLRDGYVTQLRNSLQHYTALDIVQLSVGATSSLAAVARLHETAGSTPAPDVILYEYAINDSGHFSPRAGGIESWQLCLYLLLKTAARLYPDALFVPLILAQQQHFAASVPHALYDAQRHSYAQLGLSCIDMRAQLSALFLQYAPDWLYSDSAHYAVPQASSIVGALVAQQLLGLLARRGQPGAEALAQVWQRLQASSPLAGIELVYVPAQALQAYVTGPCQPGRAENRLMALDYLRLLPGSRLELNSVMYPLALFLKSDARHDWLQLELQVADGSTHALALATRHIDAGPHNFIHANIPLPLLWSESLCTPYLPTRLALTMPLQRGGAQTGFDCFGAGLPGVAEHYCDLTGLLMLSQPA
ncbi:hypothetical protein [Pseudoduganella danionis]|uniref:hypothetical protein n=1 Tax=Pseudoduganella danionis TaxID=1890295 RepID=UPI0035B1AC82